MAYVNVEIELSEFSDDELLEELSNRGLHPDVVDSLNLDETVEILQEIWALRRVQRPWEHLMDRLLWTSLGKVV